MNTAKNVSVENVSYEQFIEVTVIQGIRKMQADGGLTFLSFGIIATSIEALGAFFDTYPFEKDGRSYPRFRKAIEELFKPLG